MYAGAVRKFGIPRKVFKICHSFRENNPQIPILSLEPLKFTIETASKNHGYLYFFCKGVVLMCISNPATRLCVLFVLGITIGTTNAIAQNPPASGKPVEVKGCSVLLLDQVQLSSGVPGILDQMSLDEGDAVASEQVVLKLQADVIKAQKAIAVKEAKNDVEIRYARKAAELADAEYRKALEANRRLAGVVAEVEVDRLRLAAERAHLQIEQAEHQLAVAQLRADEAEANFQVYQLKAPFSGIVTRKFKSRGEAVRQGEPILEIKSTQRVRVEGYIGVKDMYDIARGDKVIVQLELADMEKITQQELDGFIKFVDLSVEPITQKVRVWAEVHNPDAILKPGLNATMKIFPGTRKAVETTQLSR